MANWSSDEIEMLIALKQEGRTHDYIVAEFHKNGYPRTLRAIGNFWHKYSQIHRSDLWDVDQIGDVEYRQPRILVYDLETTDLDAGFGEILMMGYQWWDESEPQLIGINDFPGWKKPHYNDRDYQLCKSIYKIMGKADLIIGHFSSRFDHPFIQTRMLKHKLPPIPDTPQIDTWKIAKKQLRLRSNRLGVIAEALGCDQQKGKVDASVWRMAKGHDEEAIRIIGDYCLQDIRTQKSITERLLPVAKSVGSLNLLTEGKKHRCMCGSWRVVRDGEHRTKVNVYERFRCLDCGRWSRGRKTLTSKKVDRHAK
jgi:uncharacterized protein YprB with RNaseH-like and TPR domain